MSEVPERGSTLRIDDVSDILESLEHRKARFPDEMFSQSLAVVLFNIGDRYTSVQCINGEWSGHKKDLPYGEGIPKCPNGHVMMEGVPLRLGWVDG